jgi:predicted amidophosphoribosyltransferase
MPTSRLTLDLLTNLRRLLDGTVALIWPGPCILCDAPLPGSARNCVCPPCWAALPSRTGPGCPTCDLPWPPGRGASRCEDCRRLARNGALAVDAVRAAFVYEGTVVTLHRRLKLAGADALVRPLARRMAVCWALRRPWRADLVVPVPADPLRIGPRRRVPRQLARAVARELRLPLRPGALRKRRPTRPQSRLRGKTRRAALRGAYAGRRDLVRDHSVLLVDDVATTGGTLNAAAAALKEVGARRVAGLVLGRTP